MFNPDKEKVLRYFDVYTYILYMYSCVVHTKDRSKIKRKKKHRMKERQRFDTLQNNLN